MVGFVKFPAMRPQGKYNWELVEDLVFVDGDLMITVPKGFVTDFASVPRFLWSLLPPWSMYGRAAILHDYLLKIGIITFKGKKRSVNRKEADHLFLKAMKTDNVKLYKQYTMFFFVRIWSLIKGEPRR